MLAGHFFHRSMNHDCGDGACGECRIDLVACRESDWPAIVKQMSNPGEWKSTRALGLVFAVRSPCGSLPVQLAEIFDPGDNPACPCRREFPGLFRAALN